MTEQITGKITYQTNVYKSVKLHVLCKPKRFLTLLKDLREYLTSVLGLIRKN